MKTTPFGNKDLYGSVEVNSSTLNRVILEGNTLKLRFRQNQTKSSFSVSISGADVHFKEPLLLGNWSYWNSIPNATEYCKDIEWKILPSNISYEEYNALLYLNIKNFGEEEGNCTATVNCSELITVKTSDNNKDSQSFRFLLPQGQSTNLIWNLVSYVRNNSTSPMCSVDVVCSKLPLWSNIGKSFSCNLPLKLSNGSFLEPCSVIRPSLNYSNSLVCANCSSNAGNDKSIEYFLTTKSHMASADGNHRLILNSSCRGELQLTVFPQVKDFVAGAEFSWRIKLDHSRSYDSNITCQILLSANFPVDQCTNMTQIIFSTSFIVPSYQALNQSTFNSVLEGFFSTGDDGTNIFLFFLTLIFLPLILVCTLMALVIYRLRKGRWYRPNILNHFGSSKKSEVNSQRDLLESTYYLEKHQDPCDLEDSEHLKPFDMMSENGVYRIMDRFCVKNLMNGELCSIAEDSPILVTGMIIKNGKEFPLQFKNISSLYYDTEKDSIWIQTPHCMYLLTTPNPEYEYIWEAVKKNMKTYQ
eukprot:Sdes_comp20918_c0_seq1m18273